MTWEIRESLTAALPLLLETAGLAFTVFIDPYIRKNQRRAMFAVTALLFVLILQNYANWILDIDGTKPFARTVVGIAGYAVRPAIIVLFCHVVDADRKHLPAWLLIAVNALVYLTALFSGLAFYIDAEDSFHRGPLSYCCHAVSGILLIYLLLLSLKDFKKIRGREAIIPTCNALLIAFSVYLDGVVSSAERSMDCLTVAVVGCSIFYYIWLHLRFVREHERALMAEQRIRIMMSQIQPHFLYNTLSTIQALCLTDPQKAFETIEKFGTYLRQNIDSLNRELLIPFEKELGHTKTYADIEMLRFPNISVVYEISDDNFLLPALTVQPMVENAIRHGVRIRDNGRVLVASSSEEGFHVIRIADNGRGFDLSSEPKEDGKHIGIANVRERIEKLCGGKLLIESGPDRGTVVTIKIPWGGYRRRQ